MVVGFLGAAGVAQAYQPLAWSTPTLVDELPSQGGMAYETSLSCPATDLCVAGDTFGRILTTSDPASGDWNQVAAAKPGDGSAFFNSISCPTRALCVAVDYRGEVVTST